MGIFDRALKIFRYSETSGFANGPMGTGMSLASPFGGAYNLSPVIAQDLGLPYGASVSALDAYKVPAVSKALALLCGTAANCSFVNADGTDPDAWLNNTTDAITPGMRTAALVSDLILFREAVWFVVRDDAGNINGALHLPRDTWQLDPNGQVLIGGKALPAANVLYFQSLRAVGLLTAAADSIESYHDIVRTIRSRAKNPIPMLEIHVTTEFAGTKDELQQVVTDWSAARKAENGAVAVTPDGIELNTPGANIGGGGEWLVEARNANRLDVANFTNVPASMLEGNSGASGTYENTLQNKDEYLSLSLAEWLLPIQQRLSQPDACGKPVRLDTSGFTTASTADTAKGNTGHAVAPTTTERELEA